MRCLIVRVRAVIRCYLALHLSLLNIHMHRFDMNQQTDQQMDLIHQLFSHFQNIQSWAIDVEYYS